MYVCMYVYMRNIIGIGGMCMYVCMYVKIIDNFHFYFRNNVGDIQLMSLAVFKDHCKVRLDQEGQSAFLIGGKGDTWRNGHRVGEGIEEKVRTCTLIDFHVF